jgi:hypothetical protein
MKFLFKRLRVLGTLVLSYSISSGLRIFLLSSLLMSFFLPAKIFASNSPAEPTETQRKAVGSFYVNLNAKKWDELKKQLQPKLVQFVTLNNPTDLQVVDDFKIFVKNKTEFAYTPDLKSIKVIQNLSERDPNNGRWTAVFPLTLSWNFIEPSDEFPDDAFNQFIVPSSPSYKRIVKVQVVFSETNQIESYKEEPTSKPIWKVLHLVPVLGGQCPIPKCVGEKSAAKYFSKALKDKQDQRRKVNLYLPAGIQLEETGYFADGSGGGRVQRFESLRQFRLKGKSFWALTYEALGGLDFQDKDEDLAQEGWSSEITYIKKLGSD